ncbi:MAG: MATE family efflux transporter [Oscillospiraceae bacterium]|nr:MATE family efflux transporter [Oscillospiraceae bacterium]
MEQKSNRIYAEMPPVRLFFHAAIPGVISMFAMSIYSIIEGIFVGQFVGGDAFAAMNLAMPLVMINFALADLMGVGSSVPISIALGQKEEEKASNIFSCAVLLIVLAGILTGTVMFLFAPNIIQAMGAENLVAEYAVEYLRIAAAMGPLANLVFAMDNFLRISGFIKGSMLLNLLMSGLQIVFVILLVAVWKLGLVGSALAINLGFCICAVISLIPFILGKSVLKFRRPKFSLPMLKQIVACGMPNFLNNIAGRLFSLVMNVLLIRMGGTLAVSAFSVLMYCSDLVQPVLYGLCDSMQPAIGFNWGAASYKRVKSLTKCVFTSTAVVSAFAFVLMLSIPKQLVSIFVDSSEVALLDLSAHALRLCSVKFFFWWFGFAAQSFFNAIQKPKNAAILTVSTAIVFPLLMVCLLWPLGLDGLWLNQAATYVPVGIIAFVMLRKTQKELAPEMQ